VKTLVVYDSVYGNTEKIARAIGDAVGGEVRVLRASETKTTDLDALDFLIVGSPTQAFRALNSVQSFIGRIPGGALKGVKAAAFDTRMPADDVGKGLRFMMKIGGYAAPRIADSLKKKGGDLVAAPEGFFVKEKEGPVREGELERAAAWAKQTISKS
jgi:flavodoxin